MTSCKLPLIISNAAVIIQRESFNKEGDKKE